MARRWCSVVKMPKRPPRKKPYKRPSRRAKPAPLSRKSVDRTHKPPGLDVVLAAITDITREIDDTTAHLELLHANRVQMYARGRELGGTLPQLADAASVKFQTVKYHLARLK